VEASALHRSFDDRRGTSRRHEAIDIMAPRHTPVVAADAGKVARLFYSKAGGITVYQFDAQGQYVYYYAHLERYAEGLREGDTVSRGQVLGYVGTSGNAPPDAPHLHFAIFRLTEPGRWWEGTPIDPYEVLRGPE
jgi:murein DD-endopeptidase MepM/ murein hydrolase activator NlpD